jgi:hypothetical protein
MIAALLKSARGIIVTDTPNVAPDAPNVTDTLPDRLCVDPSSRYYDEKLLARNIGIRFNGVERTNVEEYCMSEGWIRSSIGKSLDRRGRPLTVTLKGTVEPFFKD